MFLKICEICEIKHYLKETPTQMFSCEISQIFKNTFFTEHLRWLLLEGVCEGTSLVKILQSCHFDIFEINHRCFRKIPIKVGLSPPNIKGNIFLQKLGKNKAGRLVPDLFLFFEKALYEVKTSGLQFSFNIFR